jgi:hypothetical protein
MCFFLTFFSYYICFLLIYQVCLLFLFPAQHYSLLSIRKLLMKAVVFPMLYWKHNQPAWINDITTALGAKSTTFLQSFDWYSYKTYRESVYKLDANSLAMRVDASDKSLIMSCNDKRPDMDMDLVRACFTQEIHRVLVSSIVNAEIGQRMDVSEADRLHNLLVTMTATPSPSPSSEEGEEPRVSQAAVPQEAQAAVPQEAQAAVPQEAQDRKRRRCQDQEGVANKKPMTRSMTNKQEGPITRARAAKGKYGI